MQKWTLGLALAVCTQVGAAGNALAEEEFLSSSSCRMIHGTFEVETYSGPDCQAPAGLCGAVTWRGDLSGTSAFVATSTISTVDTPTTGVVMFTGDAMLTLGKGTIQTKDAVVFRTVEGGEFAEVDTIVGGTGAFANAKGAWRADGTFEGSHGSGRYDGRICGARF